MSITEVPATSGQQEEKQYHTLVVVTHTHWDREWYLPFQVYRLKLVRLVDKLLEILDNDPEFKYFTLDGQTIVLEDYLEIRPEREADLKRHIASGRLLVGPWYILPDQFLISGEAHIQNMLRGLKISASFGQPMKVGYIPDPFGHISQMPQLLRGFDIENAIFWRGVGPEINKIEFLWEAPDGSVVQTAHLPGSANIGGYSTALAFNTGADNAIAQVEAVEKFLIKRSNSGVTLLMNGNDHAEPSADLPQTLRKVEEVLQGKGKNYRFVHGTMPQYLQMVKDSGAWDRQDTLRHKGEFRHSQVAHLLPGVLSARMWIKQWNARIENLLERETGLALAWSRTIPTAKASFQAASLDGLYQTAWKYLLQNDPHDSICGCSIDQVHKEMKTRYASAEQVGTELRNEGLQAIVATIGTDSVATEPGTLPVVVFNPVAMKRTEVANLEVAINPELEDPIVTDTDGTLLPFSIEKINREVMFTMDIPAFALNGMAAQAGDDGKVMGFSMTDIKFERSLEDSSVVIVDLTVVQNSPTGTPPKLMTHASREAQKFIEDEVQTFKLTVYRQSSMQLQFLAKNVPPCGYKTFLLRPRKTGEPVSRTEVKAKPEAIENEFYEITIDEKTGLLTVLDKETGAIYHNLHQVRDMGDAGDEYNFSPVAHDKTITTFFDKPAITVKISPVKQQYIIVTAVEVPYYLSEDRQSRISMMSICPLTTTVTLAPGVRRIDFETEYQNKAEDHRLQVVFPAPFVATESKAEGVFDVVSRPVTLPKFSDKWMEDPMPQAPQKTFVSINDEENKLGLTVMNVGLPEYEIVQMKDGDQPVSAIAVTLLRCVGWLSRDDLKTRRGHAGPGLKTPGAQCDGDYVFRYSVMPHKSDWLMAGAQAQAHAFNHPLTGLTGTIQSGEMPASTSFVEILPRAVALSTIKRSEDGLSTIIRVWNPSDRDIPAAKVKLYRPAHKVSLVGLDEKDTAAGLVADDNGWYSFPLDHHKIATLRVDF